MVNETKKIEQMLEKIFAWDVNITCLAQTCVAWEHTKARKVVNLVTTSFDRNVFCTTSTSKANPGSLYKPGGTAILIDGDWAGKIVDRG